MKTCLHIFAMDIKKPQIQVFFRKEMTSEDFVVLTLQRGICNEDQVQRLLREHKCMTMIPFKEMLQWANMESHMKKQAQKQQSGPIKTMKVKKQKPQDKTTDKNKSKNASIGKCNKCGVSAYHETENCNSKYCDYCKKNIFIVRKIVL